MIRCPGCGRDQFDEHKYCEDCGALLRPAQPAAFSPRDRFEIEAAPHLAGVSDRGNRHLRNDDFLALAAHERGDVLVVCDGVSSSQTPHLAAEAAAKASCAALLEALARGAFASQLALLAALVKAEAAVRELPYDPALGQDPPETTIVAALRHDRHLTVGWLGDSRAYLIAPNRAHQLTEDHSWVNEVVAAGEMTLAEARRAPEAHCITRTLGGHGHGDQPSLAGCELPDGPGLVVLCSDGLWNYVAEPNHLAALVNGRRSARPLSVAQALVAHALGQRGHDNVTVAVLAFGARP
jgi:serine/threonine protein phosphatase PrpC